MDRIIEADELTGPHAWIQWKGTNVCMDVHCECGHMGHVDSYFAYFYRCPSCEKLWAVGASVRLHELTADERADVERNDAPSIVTDMLPIEPGETIGTP